MSLPGDDPSRSRAASRPAAAGSGASRRNRDRPVPWVRRLLMAALLPLALLAARLAAEDPGRVESFYARGAYPVVVRVLTLITGWFPFSLGELAIVAAAAGAVALAVRALFHCLTGRRSWLNVFLHGTTFSLAAAGLLSAAGLVLWGFNYQRLPLEESSGLDTSPAPVTELRALCEELVERANGLRLLVKEDGEGVMRPEGTRPGALERVPAAVERAIGERGYPGCTNLAAPKGVLLSALMTRIGISGFYFPLTGEANMNRALPAYQFLFTACHETAHMSGFAAEDEANFIAAMACAGHDDADFRYAGSLVSLGYALRALAEADGRARALLTTRLSEGVRRDLRSADAFWKRNQSALADLTGRINDVYLKSQGQKEGVRSYGRMVDLLIAERRTK